MVLKEQILDFKKKYKVIKYFIEWLWGSPVAHFAVRRCVVLEAVTQEWEDQEDCMSTVIQNARDRVTLMVNIAVAYDLARSLNT